MTHIIPYVPIDDPSVWTGAGDIDQYFHGKRYSRRIGFGWPARLWSLVRPIFRDIGKSAVDLGKQHIKEQLADLATLTDHGEPPTKTKKTPPRVRYSTRSAGNVANKSPAAYKKAPKRRKTQGPSTTTTTTKKKKLNNGGTNDIFG